MKRNAKMLLCAALALVLALGLSVTVFAAPAVEVSAQTLIVDGKAVICEKYNIDGSNYFKLRDLAALLSATGAKFNVAQGEGATIVVTPGEAYAKLDGDLVVGADNSASAVVSEWKLIVDGEEQDVSVYNIGDYNYFKLRDLGKALDFNVDYYGTFDTAAIRTDAEEGLLSIVIPHEPQPRQRTSLDDASYAYLFKEDTAEAGIRAIIAAGKFSINGFAVPTAEEQLGDGFKINGSAAMSKGEDGKYTVGRNSYDTYADAAYSLVGELKAGVEIKVYDADGDGYADKIDALVLKAMIVGKITENSDGTYSVVRAGQSVNDLLTDSDGRLFDDEDFTGATGEKIKKANFDSTIKVGDMVLFHDTPDGWIMERATEVYGILVFGADHDRYQIDEANYGDEMGFSRNNLPISNRPGEIVSAHEYFGFLNNKDGLKVSLWLVPTTDAPAVYGAPIGFTTGSSAKTFLTEAVQQAKAKLASVVASEDGSDVGEGQHWVKQAVYDELDAAIQQAETVLAANASSTEMDFQVYRLYLVLNGSGDDIGAKFSGWAYDGFDNQLDGAVVEESQDGGFGF